MLEQAWSSIPRTHAMVEEGNQLHRIVSSSHTCSDMHAHDILHVNTEHSVKSHIVEKQKIPTGPTPCLDDWARYQQKCFYFSENIMTWVTSQSPCASHTATLTVFNTPKELVDHSIHTQKLQLIYTIHSYSRSGRKGVLLPSTGEASVYTSYIDSRNSAS